ncbi:MAG: tRNA (adenosine(37)-N6)-threonylcarbamoyltransferase complex dimerization subunit type 1 TsaB [Planctomycetaceae bacterium]|nr:tRNA (adenosine(37)-N6)-threonylcarbamoyltransferase complex dimerization subunit type 1 TsaB [Planctomycetaceae bacterium]
MRPANLTDGTWKTLEMIVLGIETSGFGGSVALRSHSRTLSTRTLTREGRRHAQTLVAEIARLFKDAELNPIDCDLVAVSAGPGSFTGLRVGIVCANTFAYSAGARLIAVDTFLAIAENAPPDVQNIQVVGNAQREELFVGRFQRQADASLDQPEELTIEPVEAWCQARAPGEYVTGPGVELVLEFLPDHCRIAAEELRHPTAETVAAMGERHSKQSAPPGTTLEPLYLRKSAAEEKLAGNQGRS